VIGRLTVALVTAGAVASCAARLWLGPVVIDEYANVKVRVYRAGQHCRLEVTTPTETIITLPPRCAIVPRRVTP